VGCAGRCSFCALWKVTGGKYLTMSPEIVVEDLHSIEQDNICFTDDDFLLGKGRQKKLTELMREAGIKKRYWFMTRADRIAAAPDLVEEWTELGLKEVFVGFEGFRDKDLEGMNKGTSVATNESAVQILKDNGIAIMGAFIIGLDWGVQDFRELLDYVKALDITTPSFTVMTPLPGTDFYRDTKGQFILKNSNDYMDCSHALLPTRLPLKEFYYEYSGLYRETWADGGHVTRTFPDWSPEELLKMIPICEDLIRAMRLNYEHHLSEEYV
jgi:radical SAM superfamily enzyme YgiQ (UPF0313 family)